MSVHGTHCCSTHGCKYGDEDCPVVLGTEPGISEEWCEMCQWDANDPDKQENKRLKAENAKMVELLEWIADVDTSVTEYKREVKIFLHTRTLEALKKDHSY